MLVNQFNGGEHSRPAPQMIGVNEAVSYINIDETKGTLRSVKDKLATTLATSQYARYYEADDRFISFPIFTSFVEYNNDLLCCNEAGATRVRGANSYPLGLTPPATYGTVLTTPAPLPITSVRLVGTTTATTTALPVADIMYALVNVSGNLRSLAFKIKIDSNGAITILNKATNEVDADSFVTGAYTTYRTIEFSNVAAEAFGSSGVEIYRFYKGKWQQVGILGSPAATFTDSAVAIPGANRVLKDTDFANLTGTYQYLLTFYNSNTGAESGASPLSPEYTFASGGSVSFSNLPVSTQADKLRIYRVGGALSSFAMVAQLANGTTSYIDLLADEDIDGRILSSADYLPPPSNISYIEESAGMLFGAVGSTVRFTPVGKPDAWPAAYEIPFGTEVTGLAEVSNGVLVFTRTKTYILVGTGPTTIAKQLVDSSKGCVSSKSIQKVAGGGAIWVSTDGICISTGGPAQVVSRQKLGKLAINPVSSALFDDVYYCLDSTGITYVFSVELGVFKRLRLDIGGFVTGRDKLYGWKTGTLYELFASDQDLTFEYLSPRFIEGRSTEMKAYKKFYFFGKGDIIVNIIIDDEVIVTDAPLTAGDTTVIQPPQDEQRGHYVQFHVVGKGELFELEYEAARRD